MNKNYRAGYNLEYRTKKLLLKNDWLVIRSPASKGETDVFATKNGENLFIQCKKTGKEKTYIRELTPLLKLARKYQAVPILAYAFKRTPVYAREITKNNETLDRKAKNTTLEKYLKIRDLNTEFDSMIVE